MAFSSRNNDGEDVTLSMVDVLEESEELEEEAKAVLGDSDDKFCTYATGYQDRQALYACKTCTLEDTLAGICLACSYACHDGHELFELYTKRNFRCDCGNSKFPELECKLIPDKAELNGNKYNQNFRGLYCSCKRPYPDPDDDIEDEMIQCIVCEDWYHGRHLGINEVPSNYEYQEMICQACVKHCDFLWPYTVQSKETIELRNGEVSKVDIDVDSDKKIPVKTENKVQEDTPIAADILNNHKQLIEERIDTKKEGDTPTSGPPSNSKEGELCDVKVKENLGAKKEESSDVKPEDNCDIVDQTASSTCQLQLLKTRDVKKTDGALFWGKGWRAKLCRCQSCKDMYDRLHVLFLISEDDTVLAYEERGKLSQSGMSQYEKGMQALSNMDRTQQVEVLQGYHDMKSELRDFLQSFAQSGKVVQREDIDKFFGEMQAKKRQKTGPMQYFCR